METVSTSPQVKYLFRNDDFTFSPMCTEVIVIIRESMVSFKWKYTFGHRNPKIWFKRCCLHVCMYVVVLNVWTQGWRKICGPDCVKTCTKPIF